MSVVILSKTQRDFIFREKEYPAMGPHLHQGSLGEKIMQWIPLPFLGRESRSALLFQGRILIKRMCEEIRDETRCTA